jgi:hypothetical protein
VGFALELDVDVDDDVAVENFYWEQKQIFDIVVLARLVG